jgi:DNA-binding NarL/FixJ family response regulator
MVMAQTAWDITDLLSELRVPTLIIHPRGQAIFREEHAIAVAAAIPNGRLVIIDGGQSVFGDPAAGLRAIDDFFAHLTPDEAPGTLRGSLPNNLSPRETEILRLIAFGRSNQEIADQLVLSIRTVERHIANVYLKTGAHTKAQATAFAHRVGLV